MDPYTILLRWPLYRNKKHHYDRDETDIESGIEKASQVDLDGAAFFRHLCGLVFNSAWTGLLVDITFLHIL